MTVLIVDDDADIRASLQDFFEDQGFEVATAADGLQALDLLEEEKLPCVVVLDLLMPQLDGNEVYDRMQKDPRLANVPVIVSTSDPSRAPSGALIMRKPVNLDRLLRVVRQHCADGCNP